VKDRLTVLVMIGIRTETHKYIAGIR